MAVGRSLYALDVADVVRRMDTVKGKSSPQNGLKLPAHDEMIRIPAGEFLMGSDRKMDRNAYLAEFPQRKVYLDAYEIDKFEVTTVQFLKFVLASMIVRLLIDWQYDGGNFQETMIITRSCTYLWFDARGLLSMVRQAFAHLSRVGKGREGEDGRIYPWGNQMAGLSRANFGRTGFVRPRSGSSGAVVALSADHLRWTNTKIP